LFLLFDDVELENPRPTLFALCGGSFLLMGTKNSKPAKMSTQPTIDATGGDAEVAYFALG